MFRPLLALVLTVGVCGAASAQNVLRLPGNKTVEVIGLEDWTVPMLQDSLRKYADGVTLDSHACAGVLRFHLGFADASVQTQIVIMGSDTTEYVAVSVVEPADSGRVRRRAVGRDSVGFPAEYAGIEGLMRWHRGVGFALVNDLREVPPMIQDDSAAVRQAWALVDAQRRPEGFALAARVLESHPNYHARILAATILRGAPAEDALLYTLVRAMRDEVDMVGNIASPVVARMAAERRDLNWTPVVADVHALLNGSSLYALEEVMQAAVASGADGRYAAPFLAGGGHAVLARLHAEDERTWGGAHRLLVALRGEDLGRDAAAWQAWIDSLGAAPRGGE
ncbi:MAG TPA: hypothetical protein VLK84_04985 [Longimicrobium sp.]|nr:hypothetical protein [Longimicrobium sp.]